MHIDVRRRLPAICMFGSGVPGCGCVERGLRFGCEFICDEHLTLAPAELIQRKRQTASRHRRLRECWLDDDYYRLVLATGRYLKFCDMLRSAEESDARAWAKLKQAVAAAVGVPTSRVRQS